MKGKFEDKVGAVLLLMKQLTEKEIAEFIVNQNDTIEGQLDNIDKWTKAFHKLSLKEKKQ